VRAGEPVLKRSIYRGNVRWAFPHRYVGEWDGRIGIYWVPAATGEPQWKDEDELAEAVALGVFDERSAARVRAEGERVIASKPWPTGWEDWRPPSDWAPLELPEDWHVV